MDAPDLASRHNADYIDQLYRQYRSDPDSLPESWRAFFAGFELGCGRLDGAAAPAPAAVAAPAPAAPERGQEPVEALFTLGVRDLVHSYRELGHFIATLDPLGHNRPHLPLLDLGEFHIQEADLGRHIGPSGFYGRTDGTLRDLIEKLRETYCRTIGVEYMYISDKSQRDWLAQRMEPISNQPRLDRRECQDLLGQLIAAQGFEEYLAAKYVGAKRFGIEGAESFIPMLNTIIDHGAALGVDQFVLGMAHRGRLNTLAHVLHKPYEMILSEFEGVLPNEDEGDGDVKYHLGYSHDRVAQSGRKVHVGLSFNPSHLELVNPVVEGIVRAKQHHLGDLLRTRVVPVLVHGDAAFTGQGIVLETLGLSEMPYWRTGGTIHIIINNQIGFTTMPKQARFTPYPTDVAKTIQAPIFHVNGDDPEACIWAARLAIAFRQQFHCDVLIDLWCYRRHGHNEVDEPTFTQPVMYRQIAGHPPVGDLYQKRLEQSGQITREDAHAMKHQLRQRLDQALETARQHRPQMFYPTLGGLWSGMTRPGPDTDWSAQTAVPAATIRRVAEGITRLPDDFALHPKLRKLLQSRLDMGLGRMPVDWGTAEAFALGSLVLDGTAVRFVGQDAQRGTFSHRHASLHDYNTGKKYFPIANISPEQAPIIVVNTMLSELAVLGFEYGFASADPENLVIWEAQFGDFVNGAQAIIDQFIAAGESKWQKFCGLVMLLPHGYEGQGPEHSNAYLERFLSLCAENNMQVCVPTLPSQYFHLLRRQMKRSFRKPLISFMPKSLLRSEMASSRLEEFTSGTFQLVIDDAAAPGREQVRRVLLCTGKVYYTLHAAREKHGVRDVAIVRVEQLYPYPLRELQGILSRYHRAMEVAWVQEEPRNRGAWSFMHELLRQILPDGKVLTYYGRKSAASPATGSLRLHNREEQELVAQALELNLEDVHRRAEKAPQPRGAAVTD
jgi:2-oxoglutarate dehydrogenase E1 component